MAVVSAVNLFPPALTPPATAPAASILNEAPLWDRSRIAWLLNTIAVLAVSLGLWALCLNLYRQNNAFPSAYHPDERGKGAQLAENDRNYNHPQLMLEGALLLLPPQPVPANQSGFGRSMFIPPLNGDVEALVQHGRNTSAAFGAAAAVLLAWAGFAAAGWVGFLGVGLAVGLCPALLSHAHYFKEDPALVFGVAATLCAGAWALRVRHAGAKVWTLIALGIGAGLAASGKYCGAVMIIPAVLISIAATRKSLSLLLAGPLIVVAFAGVTWAGVNYRIFNDYERFRMNLDRETEHSTSEHSGLTMPQPNGFFADIVWAEAMPHVKALAVVAVPALVWQLWRRRRFGFGVWLILCLAIYLTMLAYSVIPFYRYALPATVMLYALAGLSVAWLAAIPKTRWKQLAVAAACLLAIGLTQYFRCLDYDKQFANDSRDQLREWAATGLPAGANVISDMYAYPFIRDSQANLVGATGNGPDESVERLRARGIKYVVTCSSSCDRYLTPYTIPANGNDSEVNALKVFYRELQENPKKYPVVWERVAAHPMRMFANPDIRVYRLDGPA